MQVGSWGSSFSMCQFKPPFENAVNVHQASVKFFHVSQLRITIQPIISAVILKNYINVMYVRIRHMRRFDV